LPQDQGQAGDLPAFAFRGRPDTPLAKLPDPAMPFGLHFTRGQFDVTDVTLQELAQLPNLQGLNLENSQVTPNGLRALAGRNLRLLSLPKGLRSDEGLQHYIAALHPPTELRLSNWNITDAGLPALTPLTSLQSLNLGQTRITDAGLRTLTGL
jgi:Leucine-rich repeat (LRR) protein